MKFIRCANARQRNETFIVAALVFGVVMFLASSVIVFSEKQNPGVQDFLVVAGMSFAGAILFGLGVSLLQPSLVLSNLDLDDGEEGLGVPARLIPPSPVLGGSAFPDPNEKEA